MPKKWKPNFPPRPMPIMPRPFSRNLPGFEDFGKLIFQQLSFEDLLKCRSICRYFYNYLMNDRDIWINSLKSLSDNYYNLVKNGGNVKDRIKWQTFLERLYKNGDKMDIFNVSIKFNQVLKAEENGFISHVFANPPSDSFWHFRDNKIDHVLEKIYPEAYSESRYYVFLVKSSQSYIYEY